MAATVALGVVVMAVSKAVGGAFVNVGSLDTDYAAIAPFIEPGLIGLLSRMLFKSTVSPIAVAICSIGAFCFYWKCGSIFLTGASLGGWALLAAYAVVSFTAAKLVEMWQTESKLLCSAPTSD